MEPTVIRPYTDADRDAVHRLRYATFSTSTFSPDATEIYIEDDRRVVAEVAGDIVGHAGAWRMGQYLGGRLVPMAGVASVIVAPEARGGGTASAMVRAVLDIAHEHGDAISSLYPATVVPYRRLGYEFAGDRTAYHLRTRALLDLPHPSTSDVTVRRASMSADLEAIQAVYHANAAAHPGWLQRPTPWATRRLEDIGEHRADSAEELYLAERSGQAVGYLHLARSGDGEEGTLRIADLHGLDRDAELALWRTVATSWTVWPNVRFDGLDTTLLHLALPEVELRATDDRHRWMTRFVDVAAAIAARGFPTGLTAEVALHIADPGLAHNDGPFVLQVADGVGRLTPGGEPGASIGTGHLAALYTGWVSPSALVRTRHLTGATPAEVAALDAAFSGPTPTCVDYF